MLKITDPRQETTPGKRYRTGRVHPASTGRAKQQTWRITVEEDSPCYYEWHHTGEQKANVQKPDLPDGDGDGNGNVGYRLQKPKSQELWLGVRNHSGS